MLIKFFPNGKGAGAGPVGYLVAKRVLAYDGNRDLIRDADGQPLMVMRDPLPEVLRGDPARTEALIDASRHQWAYRAGVISFATGDAPTDAQQAEVMDAFEQLAFAGLDGEQYDVLWVRHSHENRVELHFCTPRLELTTGRSLNIAPPGYQDAYDSLRDLMNQRYGWADPMELERAQEVREIVEAPTRAQGRDELHAWILDQISMGLIEDRASMIDVLADAGFELPRVGKAYLTAQDPETGERWRLKGEIFHENWQADPAEREAERRARPGQAATRRLDGIPATELQNRFESHCVRRAAYNRERYAQIPAREQEVVRDANPADSALADDLPMADLRAGRDGDRLDDDRELFLGFANETVRVDRSGPDADRAIRSNLVDAGSHPSRAEDLHSVGPFNLLHRNSGGVNEPDPLGARLARLRRAVSDDLRNFRQGIEQLAAAIDEHDRDTNSWVGRLRELAHSVSEFLDEGIAWLSRRRSELQLAGQTLARELAASEVRRKEAETELRRQHPKHTFGMRLSRIGRLDVGTRNSAVPNHHPSPMPSLPGRRRPLSRAIVPGAPNQTPKPKL